MKQRQPLSEKAVGGIVVGVVALIGIAIFGLLYLDGAFAGIFDRVDTPTHNAITSQGAWLSRATHNGITVDWIGTWDKWDKSRADLNLTVGSCHQVQGYATRLPGQHSSQITLYVVIPADATQPSEVDLPVNSRGSLQHAVQALLASSLKPCVVDSPALVSLGGS